jgi:hypothetical protein
MNNDTTTAEQDTASADKDAAQATESDVQPIAKSALVSTPAIEYGGPSGPEPTRYGDWERKGRCIDF